MSELRIDVLVDEDCIGGRKRLRWGWSLLQSYTDKQNSYHSNECITHVRMVCYLVKV